MKTCKKCHKPFSTLVVLDGKCRNLCKRKYCLECSPFGSHNTRKLDGKRNRKRYDNRHRDQAFYRKFKKEKLVSIFGGKCYICGYDKTISALQFHHIDSEDKEFPLSVTHLTLHSWSDVIDESLKTVCLCSNCHVEAHEGMHDEKIKEWKLKLVEMRKRSDEFKAMARSRRKTKNVKTIPCKICGATFLQEWDNQKFCSQKCSQISQRKVERPDKDRLLSLLQSNSFVKVGKMFGVSDNAIRKWIE